jgi:perosamine synthetase
VRELRLEAPEVHGSDVRFAWSARPNAEIYRRNEFTLGFPDGIDLSTVPEPFWWRVGLICLHSQWPLLGPVRVVLPVRLPPGEAEFWMRLCDAEAATLAALMGRPAPPRQVELIESGPPAGELTPVPDQGVVAVAFSGGRDSLTQTALLQELGVTPLLVTVTSPREGSHEHETTRRKDVMGEVVRRRGVELVEVRSDLRSAWKNDAVAAEHGVSVSEVSDTFLFLGAALAVGAARGARAVYLASEAELSETARIGGAIVQHKHYMCGGATQRALDALLEPSGIRHGSVTSPLPQWQVQRLLGARYGDLRDLQYSCWLMPGDGAACSRCGECLTVGLNLMADGVPPSAAGIDVATLLRENADWRPGASVARYARLRQAGVPLPNESVALASDEQRVRCLAALTPERVSRFLSAGDDSEAVLGAYAGMRANALEQGVTPEPGYRHAYLELVDPTLRHGLEAILDEHFARDLAAEHDASVRRVVTLGDWIAAPLRDPAARRGSPRPSEAARDRPLVARPPSRPADGEPTEIAALVPAPEPELAEPATGRVLYVAETSLDGKELQYLQEAVATNWVSSAGPFVRRFEAAFAEASGCRFGVACTSGGAALQLALAGAGIGPGDEVILPAFTMVATANAVHHTGATPVFVDSDPETWNLDVSRLPDLLSGRTRAVIAVHTYGQPVPAEPLGEFCRMNGLAFVEDAAEAHGARADGSLVGSLGDVAAFSLYGNKIVTTGEGGIVTTNDPGIAAAARDLRDHAFTAERHFWHPFRAFSLRMSNLQAAVGLAQIERLDELLAARRRVARGYTELLEGIPGLTLPPVKAGVESVDWMYGILVSEAFGLTRDELRAVLAAEGIETRTFFVPLHVQPAYRELFRGQRFPVAERLAMAGLYLPTSPAVSEADVDRVASVIRAAAGSTKRSGAARDRSRAAQDRS